jgi:hypothetical protein
VVCDLSLSGLQFKMRHRIIQKLRDVGAVSRKTAVTIEKANFNNQEQIWLKYFAGAFLGKVKKTKDNRYFIKEFFNSQV